VAACYQDNMDSPNKTFMSIHVRLGGIGFSLCVWLFLKHNVGEANRTGWSLDILWHRSPNLYPP
jgi:hypothetical protein